MCVIACTLTADTTNSEKPWPSEISQNARVRSASRAVKCAAAAPSAWRRSPSAQAAMPSIGFAVILGAAADHERERPADARSR